MSNFITVDLEKIKAEILKLFHEIEGIDTTGTRAAQVGNILAEHTTVGEPISAAATPETIAGSSAGEASSVTGGSSS